MTKQENSSNPKPTFHPENKHQGRYDFKALTGVCPALSAYVKPNAHGSQSIDFFDTEAVKTLNKALLKLHYDVTWDIPQSYLCPPIPGRADYIHHLADLLKNKSPGNAVKCLDIGVGANCIYPLLGTKVHGWYFVGSDINSKALDVSKDIVAMNPGLADHIELRLQKNPKHVFKGVIEQDEKFDLTMCNPPFHSSPEDAQKGTLRKLKNLTGQKAPKLSLNFGGKNNELWCEGGEVQFVKNMINESKFYQNSCTWFTTLISKESNLKHMYKVLKEVKPASIKTIPMGQGQKQSRILAWSFDVKTKSFRT
jgi:23S rRNA (adenine1618-N6)-methyltransferase